MFKSKPTGNSTLNHHQWQQHDLNPSSLISHTTTCRGPGCEDRTPEPKPRWNPRPEQIRILETIFNSGMVNPPRDEIRKIRVQLQEYGQVGDANVFYWFQNRKSRSKHKLRNLQPAAAKPRQPPPPPVTNSSSSSSGKSSSPNSSNEKTLSAGPTTPTAAAAAAAVVDYLNSPTASVNQRAFGHAAASEFMAENFVFPVNQGLPAVGFCFPGGEGVSGGIADQGSGMGCQNLLLSELMLMSSCPSKVRDDEDEHEKMKLEQQFGYGGPAVPNPAHHFLPPSICTPHYQIVQGVEGELGSGMGPTKSTVFINDVCFEVGSGPFNVRESFGDDAVLIHSSGQPVLTNDWGVTLYPLQHGAFYYLLRPNFAPSPDDVRTIELI
ncbi:WUSCHEL-related homeobox 8 [Striga hermonthica]|uniref:Protein WUSCHEL n=1 Tax=Striga hermonthica TaxID=68872 RepID=A0A9N7R805_STRHE|nr:WUSCHEL-related homeobox 8 [Striga hermonthica]